MALVLQVRHERQHGPICICLCLQRYHQVYVSVPTIYNILKRPRVPHVSFKRYRPRPRRRREPTKVGQSVQVDVKHLKLAAVASISSPRLTRRVGTASSYAQSSIPNAIPFIDEVHRRLPVAIERVQTDHGNDFGTDFNVAASRISALPIATPGRPESNGKVERSHRTDGEEFYHRTTFRTVAELTAKMRRWEHEYNHRRPHLALAGKTPAERLWELGIRPRTCSGDGFSNTHLAGAELRSKKEMKVLVGMSG